MIKQLSTMALGASSRSVSKNYQDDPTLKLRERNETIAALEKARSVESRNLVQVRSELDELRVTYKREKEWQQREVEQAKREKEAAERKFLDLERAMNDNSKLVEYAKLVDESASTLENLRAQLCKALKKMEVMAAHTAIMKQSCDDVVNSLKEELSETVDEKCKIEVELMSRLAVMHDEKRLLQQQCEAKMYSRMREINLLEGKLKESRKKSTPETVEEGEAENNDVVEKEMTEIQDKEKAIESLQTLLDASEQGKRLLEGEFLFQMKVKDQKIKELERDNYEKDREIKRLKMDSHSACVEGMVGHRGLSAMNGVSPGVSTSKNSDDSRESLPSSDTEATTVDKLVASSTKEESAEAPEEGTKRHGIEDHPLK